MKILTASHLLPISSSPIENGAIAIDGGMIVDVGPVDDLSARYPHAEAEDLGEAAILPGLVNCHAHLEVTVMRGALDCVENDFIAWLLRLTAIRQGLTDEEIRLSALAGAAEAAMAGVTCIADIGRSGAAGLEALATVGLRGRLYQETEFCVEDDKADTDVQRLIKKYEILSARETKLVSVGISPHSPYTVGRRQLEMIARYAIDNDVCLTVHAAESSDEQELMTSGTGLFRNMYQKYGVNWQSPHCTTIEYLDRVGILGTRPLLAHCVHVSDSDLWLIADSRSSVAHCPKSNAKFGHGWAPLQRFLEAGVAVGLGSDSVASNNTCDIIEEGRFAALAARNRPGSRPPTSAHDILEAATLGGARAMGVDALVGSLEPGKQADLAIISLAHLAQAPVTDVEAALVFSSGSCDVVRTLVAGEAVYDNGALLNIDAGDIRERVQRLMAK